MPLPAQAKKNTKPMCGLMIHAANFRRWRIPSSKASRERVQGIGVRVWGEKDPVEPNRGNVGRDEVVSVRVFDVMMGLGEKAFEGGKLRQGISRFETRGPKHVTKVGLWRVERGSLKGGWGRGWGEITRPVILKHEFPDVACRLDVLGHLFFCPEKLAPTGSRTRCCVKHTHLYRRHNFSSAYH